MMRKQVYDIARNPNDNKWYIIGYCGRNKFGKQVWMPVSNGFISKKAAELGIQHQHQADRAALAELGNV